jgi:hypothetical protein
MAVLIRIVAGVLLVAHGLVHLLFIAPDADDPSYAFSLDRSWLLPEPARRPVAHVLMVAVMAAFGVSALAMWGVPGLSGAWPWILIIAGVLSLMLLILFWDKRLFIGVIISLFLIVLAVTRPQWIQLTAA